MSNEVVGLDEAGVHVDRIVVRADSDHGFPVGEDDVAVELEPACEVHAAQLSECCELEELANNPVSQGQT
jgi:hypothetical protein